MFVASRTIFLKTNNFRRIRRALLAYVRCAGLALKGLKRKIFHDSAFDVYRDDADGYLKIERSKFKYNDTHVFVDDKKYKAKSGLWELLTKLGPDKTIVTLKDKQAYKQILI
jgi:hypothetical protein